MKTVLGIDCGTQSTKAVLYDPDRRRIVGRAQAPHRLISRDDGTREQHAAWWVAALKQCLRRLGPRLLSTVAAVGVSGQQHGFVPLGQDGEVLAPVKLWNDTSTAAQCDEITREFGGAQKLIAEAGNPILPGYTASKVLWFKKRKPELYERMAAILLPHDYLNFVLTGRKTAECGDASGTGFLDVRRRCWSVPVLRAIDADRKLERCLPDLIAASDQAGRVSERAARELGLPKGVPVSAGGGDNMMGAIGTGTNTPGCLTVSLGTSGTLYGFSDGPIVDSDGRLAAFCSSTGSWLPLVCTMNCTVATELTRKFVGADLKQLEKQAAAAEPGCDGVIMLPFFNGERTPNLPNGRGCLMGLTPENFMAGNVLRASMESGIFGLKQGLEIFVRLGFEPSEIKLIGGGSKSALWRQMAADIFALPVVCPLEQEAAAFGAALQALWMLEGGDDLCRLLGKHVHLDRRKSHRPKTKAVAAYRKAYERYREYAGAVGPLFL